MKVESDFIEDVKKYTGVNCDNVKITEKTLNKIIEGFLCTIDDLEADLEEARTPNTPEEPEEYGY